MDKLQFFREITGAICGTLQIEKALQRSLPMLQEYLPVDRLQLQRFNKELGTMQAIAMASGDGSRLFNTMIPISDEAKKTLRTSISKGDSDVRIFHDPNQNRLCRELTGHFGVNCEALMVMRLHLERDIFGSLAVICHRKIRFTEMHASILSLVREPFAIALANTIAHHEIISLKNLVSDDNRFLYSELRKQAGQEIIGAHFGLRDVMRQVRQVAELDSPVLLLGETGVGKDLIANLIHTLSPRRDKPFVSVNCGAIPESLLDSELFGHEKGAFTGALSQKRGRLERADKGTIFLDEIGELPPPAQVRFLRFLQNKEIERIGGEQQLTIDSRVIAATNRPLEMMTKDGSFREDLWFRLNVFPITIPPLRVRKNDIPDLVHYFIQTKAKELKLSRIPALSAQAMDQLIRYNWPGNIRELQNIIERAIILRPQGPLEFSHLNEITESIPAIDEQRQDSADIEKLDDIIRFHIIKALTKANGKVHGPKGAATLLGINASTLRNRMIKLGITKKDRT